MIPAKTSCAIFAFICSSTGGESVRSTGVPGSCTVLCGGTMEAMKTSCSLDELVEIFAEFPFDVWTRLIEDLLAAHKMTTRF